VICLTCNGEISARGAKKFCSRKCAAQVRKKRNNCIICGQSTNLAGSHRKYCSRNCFKVGMSLNNPRSHKNIMKRHGCTIEESKRIVMNIKLLSFEEVQNRYKKMNIILLSDKYTGIRQKLNLKCNVCGHCWQSTMMNTDKGRGCPRCGQKKKTETMLLKYGVKYPSQNKEIALRQAKSSNNSYVLYCWKTGEEIVCQGSWEKVVVEYLNQNQIDFQWQIPFTTNKDKTYFVDLFLPKYDIYVEIKGYFRKDAEEKWNWFHGEYSNSELWRKNEVFNLRQKFAELEEGK
jgi:hypothetical protein